MYAVLVVLLAVSPAAPTQVLLELCEGGALDDVLLDLEAGLQERQIRCITFQMLGVCVFFFFFFFFSF